MTPVYDSRGSELVCTSTKQEWEADRASAPDMHIVVPDVALGVGEN